MSCREPVIKIDPALISLTPYSENYEDVMESILGQTSLGNLNYAPMNTNVQNFVNINTEIDTDIDINVSF